MDSQLELKLIECLSRLDDGEPIERILAGYPDDAAGLRPLLETATALADMRAPPPETVRIASRRAFLAQAHELRESASRQRPWFIRRVAIAFTALIAAVVFLSGAVVASASALPSEPLYGVKRAVEDAQLLVVSGTEKQQLAASFGQRRRDEISQLLAMQRDTAIAFEGTIEIIRPNGWEISGLYIYFDQATTVAGTPQLGSYVHIQGHTQAGRLLADSVNIEPGSNSSVIPPVTVTAIVIPSAVPSQLPSPSPQQTPSQPLASPTATLAPTPVPTAVPTARPTAAPRPLPAAVPPTAIPPAPIPPTQEDDHGRNGGDDTSGGDSNQDSDTSAPAQPGGDTSNSGTGSDDHGGDSNSGSNSGGDGSGGHGGDDHGGSDRGGSDHGGEDDHKP